jgi:ParB family chromosome partitioning protein
MEVNEIIQMVPIDLIDADGTGRTPNRRFIESLEHFGLFNPITVRIHGDRFTLVDGSRRLEAARSLKWQTIKAIIEPEEGDHPSKDLQAIVMNTQRANLRQLHVAQHARQLIRETGVSQAKLAREIHLGKSTLSQALSVLECEDLVAALQNEGLEFGAAKALANLAPEDRQILLAELRAIRDATKSFPSIRQVEARVQARQHGEAEIPLSPDAAPAAVAALRGRNVTLDVKVVPGRKTGVRLVVTVGPDDAAWIRDLLTGLEPHGE